MKTITDFELEGLPAQVLLTPSVPATVASGSVPPGRDIEPRTLASLMMQPGDQALKAAFQEFAASRENSCRPA